MGRVNLIGTELEGGWKEAFPDTDSTEIYADHSVKLVGVNHVGEICSKPLPLEENLKWVKEHYPTSHNSSCGMHVHVSLKEERDYVRLCRTPHFFMKFLLWGESFAQSIEGNDYTLFRDRISGKNRFCAMRFIPEKQIPLVNKGGGNYVDANPRYSMLNFAKGVHGTLECRVFPIFSTPSIAMRAIREYVGVVENFLSQGEREMRETVRVSL